MYTKFVGTTFCMAGRCYNRCAAFVRGTHYTHMRTQAVTESLEPFLVEVFISSFVLGTCITFHSSNRTSIAAAATITPGHLLSRRADAPAAVAPSNAKSRNTSSTCGKCSHTDDEMSLYSETVLKRLSLLLESWLAFSSSLLVCSLFLFLFRNADPQDFVAIVGSDSSSGRTFHLIHRAIVSSSMGVPSS